MVWVRAGTTNQTQDACAPAQDGGGKKKKKVSLCNTEDKRNLNNVCETEDHKKLCFILEK